jgi:hypothetical protein
MTKTLRALAALAICSAGPAWALDVTYRTQHVFGIEDVVCDRGVMGSARCLDLAHPITGTDGLTYYALDSAYGWYVRNFDPAALLPKPMDGVFDDGFLAPIRDSSGAVIGLSVQDVETGNWKTGPIGGEWIAGLGALKAKAATEHYVVMDHLLRSPDDPEPLQAGVDYSWRLKDDGKILYFWGNWNQEPTPIYLYTRMALPAAWKVPGANFTVRSAKLVVSHEITNSPNDQIRPEDFENENATGILPQHTVCPAAPAAAPGACVGLPAGTWVSAVESWEGGDGEYLPAGTVLKALDPATGLLEPTNAWYVTLDRDPFAGPNPRYRLKSSKFGQDLPGVEIPWYEVGTPTTTTIDLLTIEDPATGAPILAATRNWADWLDLADGMDDGLSVEDCPLTADLDVMYYVKGEVGKPTTIHGATLEVVWDDPNADAAPDLAVTALAVPSSIRVKSATTVSVSVANVLPGAATGTLTLVARRGSDTIASFTQAVTTPADRSAVTYRFPWTSPSNASTVTWTATVFNANDANQANDTRTATTVVYR